MNKLIDQYSSTVMALVRSNGSDRTGPPKVMNFIFFVKRSLYFEKKKQKRANFSIWQFAATFFYLVDGKMFNIIFSRQIKVKLSCQTNLALT